MPKTVLLATTPARYISLAAEISGWVFDRTVEGWTVRVYQTATAGGYGLRAELATLAPFDHLFEVGHLPAIWFWTDPDGHGEHWCNTPWYKVNRSAGIDAARNAGTDQCNLAAVLDVQPYAAVGRLDYDGLAGFTADQITEQYRQWFARRHQYTMRKCQDFPIQSLLLDHFNYVTAEGVDYARFGRQTVAKWARYPGTITRFSAVPLNDDDDGEMVKQQAALVYNVMSGGLDEGDGQHFVYWGGYEKLIDHPMQALLLGFFGSHMNETESAGSEIRASLVDRPGPGAKSAKAICAAYNHGGNFAWDVFLAGGTMGQAALATVAANAFAFDYLLGDPTVTIDNQTQQLLDHEQRISGLETWKVQAQADISALSANGGGGGGTSGINLALGATVTASSSLPGYPASAIVNGDRKGLNWGNGGGWNNATQGNFPEWVEIDLPVAKSVNEIIVYTVQDDFASPVEPTDALTFSKFGVVDFTIQALVGGVWQVVATVVGSNLVKRIVSFPAVTSGQWRVVVTRSVDGYSRIVEAEIFGP